MKASLSTIITIESRLVCQTLATWIRLRDAPKTTRGPMVKSLRAKWEIDDATAQQVYDELVNMVQTIHQARTRQLSLDYSYLCLNKYKDTDVADAVLVMRPGKWSNPCSREEYGSREACVGAFEFHLARNDYLMSSIHELKGKRLMCCCMPKICHSNVLAFVANSPPETVDRWRDYVLSRKTPRVIDSPYTLENPNPLKD